MDTELRLNDLLRLSEEDLKQTRIRLNTYNGKTHPIEVFKRNPQELLDWNYWNTKPYKVNQISIGLVSMNSNDRWLLFTVGRITKVLDFPHSGDNRESKDGKGIQVEYDTMTQYSSLFGRVVLSFPNKAQQLFRKGECIDEFIVKEILPSCFTGFEFPGYDNVSLTYEQLSTIVKGNYPSYQSALRNQKAVYLITDCSNGKLYVGSATAEYGMLLSRWSAYVANGHGGNVELKKLIEKEGFDYIKQNFQYTIIENYNAKIDDAVVLSRENYWKKVLQSKQFGYNDN